MVPTMVHKNESAYNLSHATKKIMGATW